MRIRSIRWSVFTWYALILVISLAALSWVLHAEMERTMYRDADAQIQFWMTTAQHELEEYSMAEALIHLPKSLPKEAIYAVWDKAGKAVVASEEASGLVNPRSAGELHWDHVRALSRLSPDGSCVLIGKNVKAEHDDTNQFLQVLLIASSLILTIALGGGWFLVARSLAPINHISSAAKRISAANLGERIDAEQIENELGILASTLNETFDRLEEAIERQARFTADASHELRTPLAIVLAHLELAATSDKTKEELSERVKVCQEASTRMKAIVEGLLTLARADAGELALETSPLVFAEILNDTKAALKHFADERKITITHDLDPFVVNGDRQRLRELATNLYLNAIHYNRDGGAVRVSLKQEAGQSVLCVADTGIGISTIDQPKIFDRFYRIDPARSRSRGGSGLGLAIVQWVTELHGGSIEVSSTLGSGTSFTIRIPLEGPHS